jgi:hypothetical protein
VAEVEFPGPYTKQPWEEETIRVDCTPRLADGDSLQSATLTILDDEGNDVTSSMIDGSPSVNSPYIYAKIKAGESPNNYNLRVRGITANGEKIEADMQICVREKKK